MTKRIGRLAVVLGAAAVLSAPLAPAYAGEAPCSGTFVVQCIRDRVAEAVSQICVDFGTFQICVPPVNA